MSPTDQRTAAEAGVGIFHSRSQSLIDECAICCDDEVVGHGIHPRASRSAAMFALAGQIPAPVLADLVGISTGKAAAWAKLAARDWSDYVANRTDSR